MKKFLMAALATTVMTAAVQASAQVSPEDQIKFRKAGYSFMSWNMGKIKAQVIDGSVEYNQQQILAAANAIAAIGSSGMGALYGPGTDRDVGSQTTRVKPELFERPPGSSRSCSRISPMLPNCPVTLSRPPTIWWPRPSPAIRPPSAPPSADWARPASPATTSTARTELQSDCTGPRQLAGPGVSECRY